MSGDKVLEDIKTYMRKIDEVKIHFTLRKMRLSRVSAAQVRAIRIFLALRHFGMHVVSTNMFFAIYGKSRSNVLTKLHLLGDKGVLTWVRRNGSGPLRYMLSKKFLDLWNSNTEQ